MVDYDKASGEGTLRIRDLGSTVEYWVKAGYSNFWWQNLSFNVTANGTTTEVEIDYQTGADWHKVATRTITSTQTTTFKLNTSTGTSSLAGPTTHSVVLDRGSAPSAPTTPSISSITSTSVFVTFADGSNGGLAIDTRRIGYGTSSAAPQSYITSDRSTSITGLTPGTTYYFWAQTHNSKGWSPLSGRSSAKTLKVPDAPSSVTLSALTQVSVNATFKANGNGGATIIGYQLARNTSNTLTGATIVSSDGSTVLSGLLPGRTYYFWARAQNSVGWGPWSAVSSAKTIAGAYVIYGGVPKPAVPYVKESGVWKVARPWARNGGIWKEST